MRALGLGFLAVAAACLAGPAAAAHLTSEAERILDFDSRIRVHTSGAVTVTETIRVVAGGHRIKRGIYRDFPTTYRDRYGNTVRVGFEVLEVLKNGRSEPYHVERVANGMRVYIGSPDRFLRGGTYSYAITYRTLRQLGFFEDFDELYWNVTGNGWAFVIERARAVVELPPGAEVLDTAAYTGAAGARGGDVRTGRDANGKATFATTRRLAPREGLTIAVSWPKGIVHEPTATENLGFLLRDNAGLLLALLGLGLVAGYYLLAWDKVGRDPPRGTIVPLFAPPEGFSPAAVRFVMRMGYDNKVFAAAVVIMAVKGYLTIDEDGDGDFTLRRTGASETALSAGERKLARRLFAQDDEIELKNANHERIQEAIEALKKSLRADFEKLHFVRNARYAVPGLALSVLALVAVVLSAREKMPEAALITVWLAGWTAGCYFLVTRVVGAWRSGQGKAALGNGLFALPFLVGEVVGLGFFAETVSLSAGIVLLVIVLINALFYHLLKAPTLTGRRVMDQVEGFKLYLSVAEKERLGVLNPPDKTPELFERYLPYALALDVENEWAEQFAGTLAAAGSGGAGYAPGWYSGRSWGSGSPGALASHLGGSFSGAISASSTAPGSSSGSGGGGFSGGGGGGGGGGGW